MSSLGGKGSAGCVSHAHWSIVLYDVQKRYRTSKVVKQTLLFGFINEEARTQVGSKADVGRTQLRELCSAHPKLSADTGLCGKHLPSLCLFPPLRAVSDGSIFPRVRLTCKVI